MVIYFSLAISLTWIYEFSLDKCFNASILLFSNFLLLIKCDAKSIGCFMPLKVKYSTHSHLDDTSSSRNCQPAPSPHPDNLGHWEELWPYLSHTQTISAAVRSLDCPSSAPIQLQQPIKTSGIISTTCSTSMNWWKPWQNLPPPQRRASVG